MPIFATPDKGTRRQTFGGTIVAARWSFSVKREKQLKQDYEIYLSYQDREMFSPATPFTPPQITQDSEELPCTLAPNTKIDMQYPLICIDQNRLRRWEQIKHRYHGRRYISQDSVMWKPAQHVAEGLRYPADDTHRWQWCHLIAYSMGGLDGLLPPHKSRAQHIGPQVEANLALGTVEANARMLIVENLVKKIINQTGQPLYLKVIPEFDETRDNPEFSHLARYLSYTVQSDDSDDPATQITFKFNMRSHRKIFRGEIDAIELAMSSLFLQHNIGIANQQLNSLVEQFQKEDEDISLSPSFTPLRDNRMTASSSSFMPNISDDSPPPPLETKERSDDDSTSSRYKS